jgi:hypothetical protein
MKRNKTYKLPTTPTTTLYSSSITPNTNITFYIEKWYLQNYSIHNCFY